MNLSNETVSVLKNFATINQNLVIKSGNSVSTISAQKNIIAKATVKETFQKDFAIYVIVQIIGGLIGVFLTHYIFNIQIIQVSQNIRGEIPLFVSEIIATTGLLLTILFIRKTDSPSFANPAVTIARIFTDTFTGIAPVSVKYFISGQIIGCLLANFIFNIFDD